MTECTCAVCKTRPKGHAADAIADRYRVLAALLFSARSQQLVTMRGEFCAACGGGPSTKKNLGRRFRGPRTTFTVVCATCDRPWKGIERDEIRVRFSVADSSRVVWGADGQRHLEKRYTAIPRGGSMHGTPSDAGFVRHLEEWIRVRPLIENRPRTGSRERCDAAVVSWLAYLEPTIGSYTAVQEYGEAHRPELGAWWTAWRIRDGIRLARETVWRRAARRRSRLPVCRAAG